MGYSALSSGRRWNYWVYIWIYAENDKNFIEGIKSIVNPWLRIVYNVYSQNMQNSLENQKVGEKRKQKNKSQEMKHPRIDEITVK